MNGSNGDGKHTLRIDYASATARITGWQRVSQLSPDAIQNLHERGLFCCSALISGRVCPKRPHVELQRENGINSLLCKRHAKECGYCENKPKVEYVGGSAKIVGWQLVSEMSSELLREFRERRMVCCAAIVDGRICLERPHVVMQRENRMYGFLCTPHAREAGWTG